MPSILQRMHSVWVGLDNWCVWPCAYQQGTGRCRSASLALGAYKYWHVAQGDYHYSFYIQWKNKIQTNKQTNT